MEQKRKVKSLISVSETGEMWIFSKFLIALSCIFCFWTVLMLALCVSYVDAADPLYSLYSWWVEERSETLYRLDFTRSGSLATPEAHIYMKSNAVWKNNLYIEPYPIVVQKKWVASYYVPIWAINDSYLNFLWWDELNISSPNISIIWWNNLTVEEKNPNATIFGGYENKIHESSASSSVIVWWYKNNVKWTNGVIIWWAANWVEGKDSFVLWWESSDILGQSSNVIVAWVDVNTPDKAQLNNVFVYSEGFPFYPKSSNAFYVNVRKWLWLKMQAPSWVASSGAVSFGMIKNIGICDNGNIWLMWLSWSCLYGCSKAGWQELWCFEEVRLTGDDTLWACRGKVYDNATKWNKKEADRYERCFSGYEGMYQNVKFETSLWTGENCPEEPGIWKNPCVYRCADGYHYYEDPEWKDSWCKKDCPLPWEPASGAVHKTIITWYSLSGVVCEEEENALWCEGVKAILQCNDGDWVKIGWSGKAALYENGKINYKYKSCETKENKCNTWVYQYTNTGILNWVNLWKCTNHRVDENLCVSIDTIYSWRCYKNHTLVSLTWGVCKTWSNTVGCRCKPNQRTWECLKTSFPSSHAIGVKTWFIQTASGKEGKYLPLPETKWWSLYTWNDETECTFKCESGYSSYRNNTKNKYECLLNCEYNGVTYENGQAISWYEKGFVTCPALCKSKDLVCHDGKWKWWTTWCITTDRVCSGYTFTKKIDNADCTACIKYKWSLDATCTTGNTMYNCKCIDDDRGHYEFDSTNTKCVPKKRLAPCTWSMPTGNVLRSTATRYHFTQEWSGWAKGWSWEWVPQLEWSGWANKWLPEEYNLHYGEWVCGFRCDPDSTYFTGENKCEWNECVDNDFGEEGSFYLYPFTNLNLRWNTKSILHKSRGEAEVSYAEGKAPKCIYYCADCYKKVDKLLGTPKCEPITFTLTFNCKNSAWSWSSVWTQEFTYKEGEKVNKSCSNIPWYDFVWWSRVKNSSKADFKYKDRLTTGNYNSCNSTGFYAVYKCADWYTGDGVNCQLAWKCIWPEPENAIKVEWTDTQQMSYDIQWTIFPWSARENRDELCAYVCDMDNDFYYVLSGGEAKCLQCEKWTYNSDTKTCSVIISCSGSRVWDPETKQCQPLAMCTINGEPQEFRGVLRLTELNWEDIWIEDYYKKERPLWKPKEFSCTNSDSDLGKHNCRFKCKNGYSCVDGKCINNCPTDQWEDYDYFYSSKYDYRFRSSRPINFIEKIERKGGSLDGRQYTGRIQYDIYINDNANDWKPICLYTCKTWAHYGSWKFEGETVYGCVSDYYCKDQDLWSAITKSNPTTWNKGWEYKTKEEFASLSATASWCFFTCTWWTTHYGGKCVESVEYQCSSYFPAYVNEEYVDKIESPEWNNQGWQYVDDLSSATTGCKYACKDKYLVWVYKTYKFCWCMPYYANFYDQYITGYYYNPSNYEPYMVGGWWTVWTYNDGNPSQPGCYYKCKNDAILASDGSCKERENFCVEPSKDTYFDFNLWKTMYSSRYFYETFANFRNWDQNHTEWTYVETTSDLKNKENSKADGCFFTCKTWTLKNNVLPDDDNYYCWKKCGTGEIFTKDGCKPCENQSLRPDTGNVIEWNAVSCTSKCKTNEVYVGNWVCEGPEWLRCTDEYDYYEELENGTIECKKCFYGTHWNETEKRCE